MILNCFHYEHLSACVRASLCECLCVNECECVWACACVCRHRRTGQHPFGGADRVWPEWIQWGGGGVVAENFPGSIFCGGGGGSSRNFSGIHILWGGRIFSEFMFFPVNCVIQTCIVFCPNNVDSLPEFMSANCPNWGAAAPPAPPSPVRLCV